MRELFEMIEATKEDFDTYIELSMVEIYNENIRDLLSNAAPPRGGLKLLENEKERVTIDGVTLKRPHSVDEVMDLVFTGNERRSTASTACNSQSSRSHAVLQINVGRNSRGHEVDFDQAVVRQCMSSATLSIIDLAGSERAAATHNMGARMKEGANINKSLLALSSCISALCQRPLRGMKPHVPYRNSKLTRMLKFSLGGNCRTVMIVCVSPSSKDIEDTHNTLVWADKAKNVATKITRNTAGVAVSVQQYLTTISQQSERIKLLEAKLNGGSSSPSGYKLKKLEGARRDAIIVLDRLKAEFVANVPAIVEGAKCRALWDRAEMQNTAFKHRLEDIEADTSRTLEEKAAERDFLLAQSQQQLNLFALNPTVQSKVQLENNKAASLESALKSAEERAWVDTFDKPETEAFKLNVAAQRHKVQVEVASARERGYREGAQRQAASLAEAASVLARLAAGIQQQVKSLSAFAAQSSSTDDVVATIDQLNDLGTIASSSLRSIFQEQIPALPIYLPSLPKGTSPVSSNASQPRRMVPPPRLGRLSTMPNSTPKSSMRVRPAASVTTLKVPASPARSAFASPGKRALRPFKVGQIKTRTPKKAFRWKDEAGEGEIDDKETALSAPVFTSLSSIEDINLTVEGSSSDEWKDEPEDRASSSSPDLPTIQIAVPQIGLMGPPVPKWKQKKQAAIVGKVASRLSALGEEREVTSSPEPGPSTRLAALGQPARAIRAPLRNRRHVTSVIPATVTSPPSATFSNLLKPTIASKSRSSINLRATAAEQDAAASPIPSVPPLPTIAGTPSRKHPPFGRIGSPQTSKARLRNSKGPYGAASARRKSRSSINLTMLDASLRLGTNGLPMASSAMNMSALAGGARRLEHGASLAVPGEGQPNTLAQSKSMALRLPSTGGPRPSIGMPPLRGLPSLTPKPSMNKINVGGDTSMRAAWK